MIIGPILFGTLVMGIAGHGDDLTKVGRLAWRSILYFEIVSTIALIVGLVVVNVVGPLRDAYSFNPDGSTLYLALASVFVAQAAGVELSIGTQVAMMLTNKGVAAVPRASLVILSGTLAAFNLPLAGITIILAVDELMDMGRTMVNLIGNCLATCVMARWEGEFTPGVPATSIVVDDLAVGTAPLV